MKIDNTSYARSSILFGRVLPTLVVASMIYSLAISLAKGFGPGTWYALLSTGFWIVVMIIAYLRRGIHPAVQSIEFLPGAMVVCSESSEQRYALTEISRFEYEGIHNRSRVPVAEAPFPREGERILVITLADETELRIRVGYGLDQELKSIAAGM